MPLSGCGYPCSEQFGIGDMELFGTVWNRNMELFGTVWNGDMELFGTVWNGDMKLFWNNLEHRGFG